MRKLRHYSKIIENLLWENVSFRVVLDWLSYVVHIRVRRSTTHTDCPMSNYQNPLTINNSEEGNHKQSSQSHHTLHQQQPVTSQNHLVEKFNKSSSKWTEKCMTGEKRLIHTDKFKDYNGDASHRKQNVIDNGAQVIVDNKCFKLVAC